MVLELLREIVREIAAKPVTFVVELVQFGVLVGIVWAVVVGFGEKRGMVANMLAERRRRIEEELLEADSAGAELQAARELALKRARAAHTEARKVVADAKHAADEEREATLATTEAEAEELRRQAEDTLAKERSEMLGHVQEQLVDLVTMSTRQILDEGFSAAEQRTMIQQAIAESLDELESVSLDLTR
jgi:F-type H+-transporting ATPase subunit b